jgi:gamma-glutamylcyclotransferase (GGCT)/AIG2-like uncharacterized protein YtfP
MVTISKWDRKVNPLVEIEVGRKVFVYGTLKKGQANHNLLLTKRTPPRSYLLSDNAITIEEYLLLDNGWFPYMVPPNFIKPERINLIRPVKGELYWFKHIDILNALDHLEGEGHLFHRHEILVQDPEKKETHQCWAYLYHEDAFRFPLAAINEAGQFEWTPTRG